MLDTTTPTDSQSQELQRILGLISDRRFHEAALALNQAQKAMPEDPRVPLLGMRMADQAGNLAGATQAARRALALAPEWPVAILELARLLARQNQGQEALEHARYALKIEPDDVQVRTHAIQTAYLAKQQPTAIEWLREGLARHPQHPEMRMFLGQLLVLDGNHAEAMPYFEQLNAEFAPKSDVLLGLVACEMAIGDRERARAHADAMLQLDPDDENIRYWHAVAHGHTPATQPEHVVARLFDKYADHFDSHLVGTLAYRVPQRIAEILLAAHPDRRFNVLDLGCGTGLVGASLGPLQGYIIGVDLSEQMIRKASELGLYYRFHRVNVLDALRDTPSDHYEAITCADVLVYVGDLAPVVPNAFRILKPGGLFLFSCEAAEGADQELVLRDTNRYAHKASYAERACREAGFDSVTIEALPVLRMEKDQPLPGFLVTARKPLAA